MSDANLNDPFSNPWAAVDAARHNFPKPQLPPLAAHRLERSAPASPAPSCWEVAGKVKPRVVDETAPARNKFGDIIR